MKNFLVDFFTVHEVQILVITKAVAAWRRRTALGSFSLSRPDLEYKSDFNNVKLALLNFEYKSRTGHRMLL